MPRSRRLLCRGGRVVTRSGECVRLLPFVNVQPFKAVTAGLSAFVAVVAWAWRHRGRPRVIHTVNLTMPPGGFVLAAAWLTRSKTSASVLDVWKPGALVPDTWPWRLDFWMQRRLLPRFDGLMVVAPAIAADLAPGRRVCVVEGGIAPDRFAHVPARPAVRPPRPFRVVLSGTLEPYNGVQVALEAFEALSDDFELVVAGTGSSGEQVRAAAERSSRVRYAGFLSFEDVLALYADADLLLNLRLTQAIDTRYFFPSKLMELLASGTPVLSTCTGQVEAEYGAVLYLLRDETPDALVARVRELAAVPYADRERRGEAARALMFREKTWRRQAARLADYLRHEVVR